MKGDQPFITATVECRRSSIATADCPILPVPMPPSFSITLAGLHTLRKATITRREKIAATISTSPVSWKFDQ